MKHWYRAVALIWLTVGFFVGLLHLDKWPLLPVFCGVGLVALFVISVIFDADTGVFG